MINAQKLEDHAEKYVSEYLKCKQSFLYFCRRYVKIELPGGDVPLIPYGAQENLVMEILKKHFVFVLKSRQIGISTIIQALVCWLVTFYKNVVIGVISKDAPEATDFARHIMSMIDKLPKWMAPKFTKRTERTFILSNGCKCFASPVAPNAPEKTLRGKSVTFLVIDEAAFIKFIDEAWTGMVPALSTNQKNAREKKVPFGTIILSTPNKTQGVGKWFYERYQRAVSKDDIFKPVQIHWGDIPQLAKDPDWYKTQCELWGHDKRKIQQELELKFIASTGSFFDAEIIEHLQDIKIEPINVMKLYNGEIWKFSDPIPGRFYIAGVDTAPEFGSDKSAVEVFDYETLEQVWEFQGKCSVTDFTEVVKMAGIQYPGCLVIENNSYGNQVAEAINNTDLSIMMYKEKKGKDQIVPGLNTNSRTRPLMIDSLYSYISEFPECIKSQRLILELIGLISKPSGRVEADTGCNDDLSLAAACAYYVRKYDPPLMIDMPGVQESSLEAIMDLNYGGSNVPFGNQKIIDDVRRKLEDGELDDPFVNTVETYMS